jgi:hypothetical protein
MYARMRHAFLYIHYITVSLTVPIKEHLKDTNACRRACGPKKKCAPGAGSISKYIVEFPHLISKLFLINGIWKMLSSAEWQLQQLRTAATALSFSLTLFSRSKS